MFQYVCMKKVWEDVYKKQRGVGEDNQKIILKYLFHTDVNWFPSIIFTKEKAEKNKEKGTFLFPLDR